MDTTIIINHLKDNFSDERYNLLIKSLYLIEEFKNDEIFSDLNDVLMQDKLTADVDKNDSMNSLIEISLINILNELGINISSTYTIKTLVNILESIDQIENLENTSELENILAIDDDSEIVLSKLVNYFTGQNDIEVLDSLELVEENVIATIKNYTFRLKEIKVDNRIKEINNFIGLFFEVFGTNNLVTELYKNDIPLGEPIDFYLPLITENEFTDSRSLAITIIGLFLMTGSSIDGILESYREKSEELLGDLSVISEVESKLISNISILKMRHKNAEERLP